MAITFAKPAKDMWYSRESVPLKVLTYYLHHSSLEMGYIVLRSCTDTLP